MLNNSQSVLEKYVDITARSAVLRDILFSIKKTYSNIWAGATGTWDPRVHAVTALLEATARVRAADAAAAKAKVAHDRAEKAAALDKANAEKPKAKKARSVRLLSR